MEDDFQIKLLRYLAAEMYVKLCLEFSRDMFNESLFKLTPEQAAQVSANVRQAIETMFRNITESNFSGSNIPGGTIH